MDQDQFNLLIGGMAQQEVNRRAVQDHRDIIKTLIYQTSRCDGSSTPAVRLWIREIELAFNQVGQQNIIQIVAKTVIDNFRSQYRPRIRKSLNAIGKNRSTDEVEVEDESTNQPVVSNKDTNTATSQGRSQEVSHEDTSITASQGELLEGSRDVSPMASPRLKKRKRQVPPPNRSEPMPFRHRPIRERRLSRRARDLIEDDDMAIDTEANLVARHFRKREHTQETEQEEAKR